MQNMTKLDIVQIDSGQCVACAICVDVCLPAALTLGPNDLLPTWRADRCSGCDECEHECPTAAIIITHSQPNAIP